MPYISMQRRQDLVFLRQVATILRFHKTTFQPIPIVGIVQLPRKGMLELNSYRARANMVIIWFLIRYEQNLF